MGNSEGMGDGTPMSQYNSRGGGAARSVVNRIGVRMEDGGVKQSDYQFILSGEPG